MNLLKKFGAAIFAVAFCLSILPPRATRNTAETEIGGSVTIHRNRDYRDRDYGDQ